MTTLIRVNKQVINIDLMTDSEWSKGNLCIKFTNNKRMSFTGDKADAVYAHLKKISSEVKLNVTKVELNEDSLRRFVN